MVSVPGHWPYPLWIAHRGAGKLAPENTLAAFRLGAAHGYRAFECDVKLSADGVPFLLHDSTLDRTTSGQGQAGSKGWADLSRLDAGGWHSRAFRGEPLPTLEAVSRFCIGNGYALDLEIKPSPGREAETGRAVAQAAAHLWNESAMPPLLTSFKPDSLEAALETAPHLPRGLLLDSLDADWLNRATALRCAAVVTSYSLMDTGVIEALRNAGMRAMAYTVNDPAEVARLCSMGIDGIVTDAIDRFSPALHALA
ncbi:MAG: glycerophosphodiester phosphodiesterase [Caldimonas sp.]